MARPALKVGSSLTPVNPLIHAPIGLRTRPGVRRQGNGSHGSPPTGHSYYFMHAHLTKSLTDKGRRSPPFPVTPSKITVAIAIHAAGLGVRGVGAT